MIEKESKKFVSFIVAILVFVGIATIAFLGWVFTQIFSVGALMFTLYGAVFFLLVWAMVYDFIYGKYRGY